MLFYIGTLASMDSRISRRPGNQSTADTKGKTVSDMEATAESLLAYQRQF